MSRSALSVALVFAVVSGVYWYFVGQALPIAVPMMLNDPGMLGRVLAEAVGALAIYVVLAMLFFRWLLSRPRF